MKKRTIQQKILLRICLSNKQVFLRSDFIDIGSCSQVGYALNKLISSEKIIRISKGIYVKARKNSITGKTTVAISGGFKSAVICALDRLNIDWEFSEAFKDYNNRKTTQIPANLEIIVPKGFRRSFQLGANKVKFLAIT